jgi:hypothetical protein
MAMQRAFCVRIAQLAFCAIVLAACQSAKPAKKDEMAAQAAQAQIQDKAPNAEAPFLGTWYVSDAFPIDAEALAAKDPHIGVRLVIETAMISNIDGRLCRSPAYTLDEMAKKELVAKATGTLPRLNVSCDGKDFTTLIELPKGNLLALQPNAAYLLERGERVAYRAPSERATGERVAAPDEEQAAMTIPASLSEPEHQEQAALAPVELMPDLPQPIAEGPEGASVLQSMTSLASAELPQSQVKVEGNVPKPGTAIHLASYKGLKAAKRGWKILLGDNDELDPLSPLYASVEIAGKGKMIRLYATGEEPEDLSRICRALVVKGTYCALNP